MNKRELEANSPEREGQHPPVHIGVTPTSFGGEALAMPIGGQRT